MTETWMKEESNKAEGEMRQRNRSRPRLIPYNFVDMHKTLRRQNSQKFINNRRTKMKP